MDTIQRKGKKARKAQQAAPAPAPPAARQEGYERRRELQGLLLETMRGILDGRIPAKQAWAIARQAQTELQLLGTLERLERMMQREKTASPRATAQRPRRARAAASKAPRGAAGWVN